jgi:hypothetical protein
MNINNIFNDMYKAIITSKPSTIYLCVYLFLNYIQSFKTDNYINNIIYQNIIWNLISSTLFLFGYYFGISMLKILVMNKK